ncbi:hypothetical protein AAVH_20008 [Aphelenchoides avenae]|nr:hypothetical protein AAVH_34926 [Aphelenchus avenae]KAH7712666.1 hypothetical protein AAVH_20008 [Aphelenchus avenae]
MSIMSKEEKRQLFLSVKEAWPEITASFAEKGVTRNTRAAAWQKVFDECRAAGHSWTNGRDGKWLSGTKWPGIVKDVKERADRNRKTGSGGDTKLSDLDEMVLDIIGRDSAGVRGLQVPDSNEGSAAEEAFFASKLDVSGASSSPSSTQSTVLTQPTQLQNFIPKGAGSSTPLPKLGALPGGLFKLPRKKRPLQQSTSQSVEDDEADEEFKHKKALWMDGMLQLNDDQRQLNAQQRYINQLKIQKLEKELVAPPNAAPLSVQQKENDEFGYYTITNL